MIFKAIYIAKIITNNPIQIGIPIHLLPVAKNPPTKNTAPEIRLPTGFSVSKDLQLGQDLFYKLIFISVFKLFFFNSLD